MLDHRGKMYEAFSFFLFIYLLLKGLIEKSERHAGHLEQAFHSIIICILLVR